MLKRLPFFLIFLMSMTLATGGLLDRVDHWLLDQRFELLRRPASQSLAIVEIDERSLRLLNVWPWPRAYHGMVVDRLREAGARTIGIDIDFSSASTASNDSTLADALERANGRAILPIFLQPGRDAAGRETLVHTQPIDIFAAQVQLGSIVIRPESDGYVRRIEPVSRIADTDVPSLPVLTTTIERISTEPFFIDFGIDLASVPRISYVDVLNGTFDASFFRHRNVLIGATAIELGDRLTVPRYLNLPGVQVLALASESIAQDRMLTPGGTLVTALATLFTALVLGPFLAAARWRRSLATALAASAVAFATALLVQGLLPISLDMAAALLALWLSFAFGLVHAIERQAFRIFRQKMKAVRQATIMRQIVESSFDAILTVDERGGVTLMNPAAAKLLGEDTAKSGTRPVDEVLRAVIADTNEERPFSGFLADGAQVPHLLEGLARRRDGRDVPVEMSVRRATLSFNRSNTDKRLRQRTVHFVTLRDVTIRRQAEQAKEHALAEAVAANRAKAEFLATMSHELRTPLNAIIGFSEILMRQMLGPIGNEKYQDYATNINSSGTRLLDVVTDILDVARIEAGQVTIEDSDVDVAACVDAAIRLATGRQRPDRLDIQLAIAKTLPRLRCDERLLKQILYNLISNAFKFTPGGGRVRIAAGLEGDGAIVISVTDTGIGIAEAEIPKLTKPFYQVDSSLARRFEGTGLGLALSHELMKLHGGALIVTSALGQGTNVACYFPPERSITRPPASRDASGSAA